MDTYTFFAALALVIAIGVNSGLVHAQKRHKLLTKKFGKNDQNVHSYIITIVWGVFIIAASQLHESDWRFGSSYPLIGLVLIAVALFMFVLALKQIGSGGLVNANFFGGKTKQLKGIYNYVPEPIYVSYCLLLFGLGVQTGINGYFLLSALAFIGLFGVEARVESVD